MRGGIREVGGSGIRLNWSNARARAEDQSADDNHRCTRTHDDLVLRTLFFPKDHVL